MTIGRREFLGAASFSLGVAARRSGHGGSLPGDDPLGARGDFPIARERIYLNAPYIGPIPLAVEEAGTDFLKAKARAPISLGDMLERTGGVREKFARLVGASPEEIGFLYATSEGENLVANALDLQPEDNVVIDALHYTTTFVLYKHLERTKGIELRIVEPREGRADVGDFDRLVDKRTRLLSVAWVSHRNGFRHDLRSLAELAHAHGAYLYTDAVQAVGMFPMDLHREGVDFLTTGTYKWLLAGYGVAPFFVRRELLERIPPDRLGALHVEQELENHQYRIYTSARKYEYATLAFGAVYQLGAALDYLHRVGVDRIEAHTVALAGSLGEGLRDLGFQVLTPRENRSSIVAFAYDGDAERARALFAREKIDVSFREEGTQIRVGPALFNNEADVRNFLDAVRKL